MDRVCGLISLNLHQSCILRTGMVSWTAIAIHGLPHQIVLLASNASPFIFAKTLTATIRDDASFSLPVHLLILSLQALEISVEETLGRDLGRRPQKWHSQGNASREK